jgi:hypothetical protein
MWPVCAGRGVEISTACLNDRRVNPLIVYCNTALAESFRQIAYTTASFICPFYPPFSVVLV